MHVTVVGAGYVGLTLGVALALVGHDLILVDIDPAKVEALRQGRIPIHEPGLEEILHELNGERISFTSDMIQAVSNAEVVLIAVGTPTTVTGEADTSMVVQAVREVCCGLQPGKQYLVVVKSTVPVGTNGHIAEEARRVLEERGVVAKVHFASNPEFQREGHALRDILYPDRIVIGTTHEDAIAQLRSMYQPILEQDFDPPSTCPRPLGFRLPSLIITDISSAELIKYAANAFLALKISFINEVAGLCERVGANVVEVARGIGLDARIGPSFLGAGIGWGGSCFPKDTAALIAMGARYGYPMSIVEAARTVNSQQRTVVVEKLESILGNLDGKTVAVLGLAFKANTDDVRDSPALDIVRLLVGLGAHVRVHDPIAGLNALRALNGTETEFCSDPYEVANQANALVLATEWDEYRSLDLRAVATSMNSPILVDGRNFFNPESARRAGFLYYGIGIGSQTQTSYEQIAIGLEKNDEN